jgi:ATP-dependent Clp protease adaptor protein ClpS
MPRYLLLRVQLQSAADEALPTLKRTGAFHPHAVILHRDEAYAKRLEVVVDALMAVVGTLSLEKAQAITVNAFIVGQATVIVCPKEIAEHYRDCLKDHGLTVTVEIE